MSIADELKKLEDLRWNGTLTDAEFAQAKAALLAQLAPPPLPAPAAATEQPTRPLGDERYQSELKRIDREWAREKDKYMIANKDGRRYVPTTGEIIAGAVMVAALGVFWTLFSLGIAIGAPSAGPFLAVKVFFLLLGVAITASGVWSGLRAAERTEAYNRAHAAYQRRRAAVRPEDFR